MFGEIFKVTAVLLLNLVLGFYARAEVLARIGNQEVKAQVLESLLPTMNSEERGAVKKNAEAQKKITKTLLLTNLVLERALEQGWDQEPSIEQQIEEARRNIIVNSYIRAVTDVPDTYPSAEELKEFYEVNKQSLFVPKQYKLAQIYIESPQDATGAFLEERMAEVASVESRLQTNPELFTDFSREYNKNVRSLQEDGLIGWVTAAQVQAQVRPLLSSMQAGVIAEAVFLDDGWYILKCIDVKDSFLLPLSEIKQELASRMRTARIQANQQAYLSSLQEQNPIAINEIALSNFFESLDRE